MRPAVARSVRHRLPDRGCSVGSTHAIDEASSDSDDFCAEDVRVERFDRSQCETAITQWSRDAIIDPNESSIRCIPPPGRSGEAAPAPPGVIPKRSRRSAGAHEKGQATPGTAQAKVFTVKGGVETVACSEPATGRATVRRVFAHTTRRTDTESERLPPLFEARGSRPRPRSCLVHRAQIRLEEEFTEMTFTHSREIRFVLYLGIEVPQRPAKTPPEVCGHPRDPRHTRQLFRPER